MGELVWVLHAHLPLVRHPEHPRHYEEDWLFEALETAYLPLLDVLEGWVRDRVDARLTVSVSPPLLAMLEDEGLRGRFRAHLDRRSAIWHDERRRLGLDPVLGPLADREAGRVAAVRRGYERRGGDLVRAFRALAEAGVVELATTALTHPLLPAFRAFPRFLRAQLRGGVAAARRGLGRAPTTFWLPECAWFDGVDALLLEAGARATVVEGQALALGRPPAPAGWTRPAVTPGGLMVLGRDPRVAVTVWSRETGFPGDPRYLDFHADQTWRIDERWIRPYLLPSGARVPLRLLYHRVTDRRLPADRKLPYQPEAAEAVVVAHAERFLRERVRALGSGAAEGLAVAPFDAELFGHWWREGPRFLDALARRTRGRLRWTTPAELLARGDAHDEVEPASTTWGRAADFSSWIAPATAPIWRRVLDAVADWERRARPDEPPLARVHEQLGREVAQAAASDWTFLVLTGTAPDYARARVEDHLDAAEALGRMLDAGRVDQERLHEREERHDIALGMD